MTTLGCDIRLRCLHTQKARIKASKPYIALLGKEVHLFNNFNLNGTLELKDPRKAEVKKIKLELLRINRKPPIIFLCGGKISNLGDSGVSARNSFLHHLATNNHAIHDSIAIAESFTDWINGTTYSDLIEFEEDIAGISSIIVLILESAGTLAELGLFVANKILKKKVVVFMSHEHYQEGSFIRLGPIQHIKEKVKEDHVCVYDWNVNDISTLNLDDIELMRVNLNSIVEDLPETERFKSKNFGHIALLIFELTKAFHAITFTEIGNYLSIILDEDIGHKNLKRSLFLLSKFRLIKKYRKGHTDYFLPEAKEIENQRVDFVGSFNQAKAAIESIAYYEENSSEKTRHRVITASSIERVI